MRQGEVGSGHSRATLARHRSQAGICYAKRSFRPFRRFRGSPDASQVRKSAPKYREGHRSWRRLGAKFADDELRRSLGREHWKVGAPGSLHTLRSILTHEPPSGRCPSLLAASLTDGAALGAGIRSLHSKVAGVSRPAPQGPSCGVAKEAMGDTATANHQPDRASMSAPPFGRQRFPSRIHAGTLDGRLWRIAGPERLKGRIISHSLRWWTRNMAQRGAAKTAWHRRRPLAGRRARGPSVQYG